MLSKQTIKKLMKNNPPLIENMINPDTQIQVNGVDFTVKTIERFLGRGTIDFDNSKRQTPDTEIIFESDKPPNESVLPKSIVLDSGRYLISLNEKVNFPKNIGAITKSRSSLFRMGTFIESAVWDSGYWGFGQVLLSVGDKGIQIFSNARICQIIFFKLDEETEGYSGIYQGERHT